MADTPQPYKPGDTPHIQFRRLSPEERKQAERACQKEASDADVYSALRLGAVGWTGTDRKFSGSAFEEEISLDEARAILLRNFGPSSTK